MIDAAEHERRLLGTVARSNEFYFDLRASGFTADTFGIGDHQRIFVAISRLVEEGVTADLLSIRDELTRAGERGVSAAYLAQLTDFAVSGRAAFSHSMNVVRAALVKRTLANIGESLAAAAQDATSSSSELLDSTEERLLSLRAGASGPADRHIRALVPSLLEQLESNRRRKSDLLGLPTGLQALDLMTRGMQPGQLIIAGARSGHGKSSFMVGAVRAVCMRNRAVHVFSLEMTREEILQRLLAAESAVPFPRIRDTKFASDFDMEKIRHAGERIASWPLYISDDSSLTVEQLTASARLSIRRNSVALVAVDYAQLVSAQGRDERLRVANVSRGLARLAKTEQVPVLVLSQLSRGDRAAPNRRPMMSELRESGQLENDAHVIVLLHREWDEEMARLSAEGEVIIAKQRSGETGAIPVIFNRRSLLFEQQTRTEPESATQTSLYGAAGA